MHRKTILRMACVAALCLMIAVAVQAQAPTADTKHEYKLLATNKTGTMQKEMSQLAEAGFRYAGVMGGETAMGGSEVVIIMTRPKTGLLKQRYRYLLLATQKTGTMQKELQAAGDEGFEYKGQTVFKTAFGGQEVVCILERDIESKAERYEFKLLATKKTGTMQKELSEVGDLGFEFVGITVGETAFGGNEVVTITRRRAK